MLLIPTPGFRGCLPGCKSHQRLPENLGPHLAADCAANTRRWWWKPHRRWGLGSPTTRMVAAQFLIRIATRSWDCGSWECSAESALARPGTGKPPPADLRDTAICVKTCDVYSEFYICAGVYIPRFHHHLDFTTIYTFAIPQIVVQCCWQ